MDHSRLEEKFAGIVAASIRDATFDQPQLSLGMMHHRLTIAHVGLYDSAPLLVAARQGYFLAEGLEVVVNCELGLASLCGKMVERRVDGVCIPAPLAVMLSLGLGVPKVRMQVLQIISRQGMGLVMKDKRPLPVNREHKQVHAPRIGVITPGTPSRLVMHRFLQQCPNRLSADFTQVPMAASQLIDFLREGLLEGVLGVDPLPALALIGQDTTLLTDSASLFPMHPNSVLALSQEQAEGNPSLLAGFGAAIRRARAFCADPGNRSEIRRLVISQRPYINLSEEMRENFINSPEGTVSMRFDGSGVLNTNEDVAFIEASCRGAIGQVARSLDIKGEINRIFALSMNQNAIA